MKIIKTARWKELKAYSPEEEDEWVERHVKMDRKRKYLGLMDNVMPSGRIKSRKRQIREIDPEKVLTPDEEFEMRLKKDKEKSLV